MTAALSFGPAYKTLLTNLLQFGVTERNERTGVEILMLRGGHSFKVPLDRLPVAGNRRYWPRVAAAETAWQFMGTKDPEFIVKHAPKLWSKFVEDGELKTAYGYRWREHFGRDQLWMAIQQLRDNPTNRQLYVSAWDPAQDGLGMPDQPKNIPCPVGFSLSMIEGALHCSVFIRSSDVFVGLPYDVMVYALTVDAIAAEVGAVPGTLHVTLAHPHVYKPHWPALEECVDGRRSGWTNNVEPNLPKWPIRMIELMPEDYLVYVSDLHSLVQHNNWDPKPELVV